MWRRKTMYKNIMTACLVVLAIYAFDPGTLGGETQQINTLVLAQDGKANATIVIATNATRAAQFAAFELRYHLNRITGGDFPIATNGVPAKGISILVGDSGAVRALKIAPATFKPQEYLIRFQSNVIILMGRDKEDRGKLDYMNPATFIGYFDEQATCYAVYDFLERFCGVRWYLPTDLGLVCPSNRTLKVTGVDVRRAPAMKYRYARPEFQIPRDLCGDTIRGPTPTPLLDRREQRLWWHRQRIGGEPYNANHSLYGYHPRFGTNTANPLFVTNRPDFFAQGNQGQMCYTSTGLISQVAQDARDYFDGRQTGKSLGIFYNPTAPDYFAVVPMDNGLWCKCPNCAGKVMKTSVRAKDMFSNDIASDYLFHFVNRIAQRVYKTHPDKFIASLAYADYAYPPTQEKLSPNISIQMCLHARFVCSPTVIDNDMKILDSWVKESKERRKFLWLYYCFPSLNARFGHFPGFFAHHIVRQMATWHKAGIRGMSYEPSYLPNSQRSVLFDQVESYVTWKLADDPTLDGNQLIDEFFVLYYGAAAKPMQAFYEQVEEIYGNPANYPAKAGHQSAEIAWVRLGTAKRMHELGGLMEQARAAARTDLEKQRVALFDKGVWQYMLAGRSNYMARAKNK